MGNDKTRELPEPGDELFAHQEFHSHIHAQNTAKDIAVAFIAYTLAAAGAASAIVGAAHLGYGALIGLGAVLLIAAGAICSGQ
jgi:hypothetical protein